jgi:uncharacterized protein involved in outer membrane biogenesis
LLLIVVVAIIIATFDWNRLKPTINQKVSTELNRPFAIRGDLGVVGASERGDRLAKLDPWPHVHADDIILGNPPDIPTSPWSTCRALKPRWPARAADQNGLSAVDQTSAARCAPDPPI